MNWRVFQPWRLWLGVAALVWVADGMHPRGASAQNGTRIRDHLYAVQLLASDEAWAVGSFGAIYHTNDRGKQWVKQDGGVIEPLYGVRFVDSKEGWIAGKSGLILHTTDGGSRWEKQASGTTHHLFNLTFLDNQRGIAVGDYGSVLQTADGGKTWQDRSPGEDVFLYAVQMHPSGKDWLAGERGTI